MKKAPLLLDAAAQLTDSGHVTSLLEDLTQGSRYRGGIDGLNHGLLPGWIVDLVRPLDVVAVALVVNEVTVIEAATSKLRDDLVAYLPENQCGFVLELQNIPLKALREIGKEHLRLNPNWDDLQIQLRFNDGAASIDLVSLGISYKTLLDETEKSHRLDDFAEAVADLSFLRYGPRFRGAMHPQGDGTLIGWAIDLRHIDTPLSLQVVMEGLAFGELVADLPRPDLDRVAPNIKCGFIINFWLWGNEAPLAVLERLESESPAELLHPADLRVILGRGESHLRVSDNTMTRHDVLLMLRRSRPADPEVPPEPPGEEGNLAPPNTDAAVPTAELMRVVEQMVRHRAEAPDPQIDVDMIPAPPAWLSPAVAEPPVWRHGQLDRLRRESNLALGLLASGANLPTDEAAWGPQQRLSLASLYAGVVAACTMASATVKQHAKALVELFDPCHYVECYQPFLKGWDNPLLEYVLVGWRAGRVAHPLFDVAYYREQAGEFAGDPLYHYVTYGAAKGFSPHRLFDAAYYRRQYMGEANPLTPFAHYLAIGVGKYYNPCLLFDVPYFISQIDYGNEISLPLLAYAQPEHFLVNPHPLFSAEYLRIQAQIERFEQPPLLVYLQQPGLHQRLSTHPLFDIDRLSGNGCIRQDDPRPLLTQLLSRMDEGDIEFHPLFDNRLYRYQVENEQGRRLQMPPVVDYLRRGYLDTTLMPNMLFDPEFYLSRNKLNLSEPALVHYLREGDGAGLPCHPLFSAAVYRKNFGGPLEGITALEHALCFPEERKISDYRMNRPIDATVCGLISTIAAPAVDLDPDFYRAANWDLANLNDAEALEHYHNRGQFEGRIGSPRDLMVRLGYRVRDLPIGMSADDYVRLNSDLSNFKGNTIGAIVHFLEHGTRENRLYGLWQLHLEDIDQDFPISASPVRVAEPHEVIDVAILIHMFYCDLWPELARFARNFDVVTRDVFVNVVDIAWNTQIQREIRQACPDAYVQLSNDNGRDIGGFVRLLDNIDFSRYRVIAFMHSKKSPHISEERGDYWRRTLLRAFAGNPAIALECAEMFKSDPELGIIAAAEWRCDIMGKNQDQYERLLDLFDIQGEHRELDYVSGTMFLVRSEIIARLYAGIKEVDWEYGGDNVLEFHMDGQVAHGVERVIPALCRHMGYKILWR